MSRPHPGDLVQRRWYLGRLALWRGERGWWVQIWLAGPCRHGQRYTNARDLWIGQRVRLILSATVLP